MRNYDNRVFELPYTKALEIYRKDIEREQEKEQEERFFGLYTSIYPFMLQGFLKGMEYEEFKFTLLGGGKEKQAEQNNLSEYSEMSEEEILNWIDGFDDSKVLTEKRTGDNIINRW